MRLLRLLGVFIGGLRCCCRCVANVDSGSAKSVPWWRLHFGYALHWVPATSYPIVGRVCVRPETEPVFITDARGTNAIARHRAHA